MNMPTARAAGIKGVASYTSSCNKNVMLTLLMPLAALAGALVVLAGALTSALVGPCTGARTDILAFNNVTAFFTNGLDFLFGLKAVLLTLGFAKSLVVFCTFQS